MADYTLSGRADADLEEIYTYSVLHFGETKAEIYLKSLEECLIHLASQPNLGRKIDYIRQDYRRYEHISHSIFYKITDNGIWVARVLHLRMKVEHYL